MRVLLLQSHRAYRFIDDFRSAFDRLGHVTDLVYAEQGPQFSARASAFAPTLIFNVGLVPSLSSAVRGVIPVVQYVLDKAMNLRMYENEQPRPNEFIFGTSKDDESVFRERFGFQRFFYLPFCSNIARHQLVERNYRHEVTFVGSLISNKTNNFIHWRARWDEFVAVHEFAAPAWKILSAAVEELLAKQTIASREGRYILPELVEALNPKYGEIFSLFEVDAKLLANLLAKEAARRQRQDWLERIPGLTVYGPVDDWPEEGEWDALFPNAKFMGPVDQYTGVSSVFYESKVNIGMQRIYARDGMSDRVFNVLASEGFLLSDRNAATEELFEDKKDLVMFESQAELADLSRYFLTHDAERERIARNGCEKVQKEHSIERRVEQMMDIVKRSI